MNDSFVLSEFVSPSVQIRTLSVIFRAVRHFSKLGLRPIVEVDLDLCSLMPIFRTRQALEEVGSRFAIQEFLNARNLDLLPGYSDEAWSAFVISLGLQKRYPLLSWFIEGKPDRNVEQPFGHFHAYYWTTTGMYEDTPTPGLGSFVQRVCDDGGDVVFLSGRWLKAHVEPSMIALRRAGIASPKLVIGNDNHESIVGAKSAVSDSQIKADKQGEILRLYGQPIAIVDDRITNREAVIRSNSNEILSIAVCLPKFSHDPTSKTAGLRISTFETFDSLIDSTAPRSTIIRRYPEVGFGKPWRGNYEGLGSNQLPYFIPRSYSENDMESLPDTPVFLNLLNGTSPNLKFTEYDLIDLCEAAVPDTAVSLIDTVIRDARELSETGFAEEFPACEEGQMQLRRSLIASWLHSRDLEVIMRHLGFALEATGVHDMLEYVCSDEIRSTILRKQAHGSLYSPWLLRWTGSLRQGERINVGFLNPHLTVGLWLWDPNSDQPQDAMDVHRLAEHHDGDMGERYDPIEATVNNLLHQREGVLGIRKEPSKTWEAISQIVEKETGAENVSKNSVGRNIIRDAIAVARELEIRGYLTPWFLVKSP